MIHRRAAVLQAEPGAGKTTGVPVALLELPDLARQRIIMLEPRRLAARAAAARMAANLGESVGETVGYRVRFDSRVGPRTRIEVVTEGVLTRLLQDDPTLEGVGVVIFDEFHERSIHADVGLALALHSRQLVRPDLRLLVMSATLDGAPLARLLGEGEAPIIICPGRVFPVETRYRPLRPEARWDAAMAGVIREALEAHRGDILAFLPGVGEIHRVRELLEETARRSAVELLPLHGSLAPDAQDRVLRRGTARRVILATAVAETSLTIDGIEVVVDGGRMRVPRFSPRTGMTRLETVRVTLASADQRRGRAGRLGPGYCYRLWAPEEERGFLPQALPELLTADLAPLALVLARAGIHAPDELTWLDPPPAAAFQQARDLLQLLGALDGNGRITPHGSRLAALALPPRLAHMAVVAKRQGLGPLAADLAALLSDRDVAERGREPADVDLRLRVEALRGGAAPGLLLNRAALRRAQQEAREWRRRIGVEAAPRQGEDIEETGRLVALAFPDRIGMGRGGPGRFLLQNGRGAAVPNGQPLAHVSLLAVAELEGGGVESRVLLAAPLDQATLLELVGDRAQIHESVAWDPDANRIVGRRTTRYGALVLNETVLDEPDPAQVTAAWLEVIRREGLAFLPWTDAAEQLRRRLTFGAHLDPTWPESTDLVLLETLESWLAPALTGIRSRRDLERLDLGRLLLDRLEWRRRSTLDEWAPERIEVPTGSRIAVDYTDPEAPVLAVRLQELFGLTETPRVGGGRVPVTLHLLSPAFRPVQVTRDLAGFWRTGYHEVRKELRARYPKHHWPEDPLTAAPVRGAKRKR